MNATIQKWGNSLAIRIPKGFAEQANVSAGSDVDLSIEGDRLVVRRLTRKKLTLEQLLAGITRKNLHQGVDLGKSVGRELL